MHSKPAGAESPLTFVHISHPGSPTISPNHRNTATEDNEGNGHRGTPEIRRRRINHKQQDAWQAHTPGTREIESTEREREETAPDSTPRWSSRPKLSPSRRLRFHHTPDPPTRHTPWARRRDPDANIPVPIPTSQTSRPIPTPPYPPHTSPLSTPPPHRTHLLPVSSLPHRLRRTDPSSIVPLPSSPRASRRLALSIYHAQGADPGACVLSTSTILHPPLRSRSPSASPYQHTPSAPYPPRSSMSFHRHHPRLEIHLPHPYPLDIDERMDPRQTTPPPHLRLRMTFDLPVPHRRTYGTGHLTRTPSPALLRPPSPPSNSSSRHIPELRKKLGSSMRKRAVTFIVTPGVQTCTRRSSQLRGADAVLTSGQPTHRRRQTTKPAEAGRKGRCELLQDGRSWDIAPTNQAAKVSDTLKLPGTDDRRGRAGLRCEPAASKTLSAACGEGDDDRTGGGAVSTDM
ncbi:hypothetical protein R3P38DRAFT_3292026 [Favolaschia claudopus]|uniref:Uncharacterized protein n=1 Tax=Favolaschia claudopus TaxID=2862362 RepID=A0AAV9ZL61_9AGAR